MSELSKPVCRINLVLRDDFRSTRNVVQERWTLKRVRLRDLGCCNGLVTRAESGFTPVEVCTSHHKPRSKLYLTVNPEVSLSNKQVWVTEAMINIICDPQQL